jgi:uncharacterized protein
MIPMLRNAQRALIPALVLAGLLIPGTAQARVFPVNDEAELFSTEAIRKAELDIRAIDQRFHKEVLVETTAKDPTGIDNPHSYFASVAKNKAREKRLDGIYILINKGKVARDNVLEIIVDDRTGQTFTTEDRRALRDRILTNFKKNDYNDGLLQGLQFIESRFAANPPAVAGRKGSTPAIGAVTPPAQGHVQPERSNIMGWICLGVAVLLVVWLFIGLIRAFSAPRGGAMGGPGGRPMGGAGYGPGYGGGYGGGGGGGGFMSGLLGGMFGAVAGNWLYNSFGGGHGLGGSWGAGQAYGSTPGAAPGGDQPADYSETGGTWGNDAGGDQGGADQGGGGDWGGGGGGGDVGGGGDWGGGGGGGGDWGGGGGDFGGGGGDFGGGGGDFGGGGGGGDW